MERWIERRRLSRERCDPAKVWTCQMLHDIVPLVQVSEWLNENLLCCAMYTEGTGSPERSYELEPLDERFPRKEDPFDCKSHAIYSDFDANIGDHMKKIKVNDAVNNFRVAKRRAQNT